MVQRWKATWVEEEGEQEFIFDSLNNLMIARIDFQLKFNHAFGGAVPERVDLEELHERANCTLLRW